jgi:hypothetical protein
MATISDADVKVLLNNSPLSEEVKAQLAPVIKAQWPTRNSAPPSFPRKQLSVPELVEILKTECFKFQILKDLQGPEGRPEHGLEERLKALNEQIAEDPDPEFMTRARDQFLKDKALYFTEGIFAVFRDNIIEWSASGEPLQFNPNDPRFKMCNKDLAEIKTAEDIIAASRTDRTLKGLQQEIDRLKEKVMADIRANKQESSPLGYLVPSPPEPPLEMVPVSQFKKNQPRLPQGFVPNPKGYFDSPPQKSYGTSRKRTRRHRRKGKKNKTKARKVKRTV